MRARAALAVLAAGAALGVAAPSAGAAAGPQGFFGMNVNGPLDDPAFDLPGEARTMRAAGVRTWRVEFSWDLIEPTQGAPDWTVPDRKVLAAAAAGIDVLGLVLRAPPWSNGSKLDPFVPPKDPAAYGRFAAALSRRYGPQGELWAAHPEITPRPVRAWEIWNEPNIPQYFRAQPFARPYARLLRAAHASLKTVDPGSQVVLAGMANFSWRELGRFLKAERGLKFDGVAVHPFTGKPSGMIEIVRRNRTVLKETGRAKVPFWLTEMTWSSAKGKKTPLTQGWETTEAGQAQRITQAYALLVKERARLGIAQVFWYTWASRDDGSRNSFEYSGLRTTRGGAGLRDKPALRAWKALER